MARNRKIFVHRNSENIHMKLVGDFDGSLASELLNVLKENCNAASKIFVHTRCLRTVHSFVEMYSIKILMPLMANLHNYYLQENMLHN